QRRHRLGALRLRVGDLQLEGPLLERNLVELRRGDVAGLPPLLADAYGLLVAVEVLAGEPETLGRDEHGDEARAWLEDEPALEVGAVSCRLLLARAGGGDAGAAAAPEEELLLHTYLLDHRVPGAQAVRVGVPQRQVAHLIRERRVRQQPGADE